MLGIALCVSSFASDAVAEPEFKMLLDARIAAILQLNSDKAYGEYLAAQCSTCHASSTTGFGIPIIHGQKNTQIMQALLEYKEKRRTNTTMQSVAETLSDEDIGALALFFSTQ